MRAEGLEPPRLSPPGPKPGASTSSATPACTQPTRAAAHECIVRAGMAERDPNVIIEHPNRQKAANKATKAVVLLLLIGSAALVAIVTIGGWSALEGAKILQVAYILLYLVMAYFVARWNRGVLP